MKEEMDRRIINALGHVGAEHRPDPRWQERVLAKIRHPRRSWWRRLFRMPAAATLALTTDDLNRIIATSAAYVLGSSVLRERLSTIDREELAYTIANTATREIATELGLEGACR